MLEGFDADAKAGQSAMRVMHQHFSVRRDLQQIERIRCQQDWSPRFGRAHAQQMGVIWG